VVTASIYMFYYLQNKAISYEPRHYYFMGTVCGVAILQWLYTYYKRCAMVIFGCLMLISVADFIRFFGRVQDMEQQYTWYNGLKVERKKVAALLIAKQILNKNPHVNIHCDAIYTSYLFKNTTKLVTIAKHPFTNLYTQNMYINLDTTQPLTLPLPCYNTPTLAVFTTSFAHITLQQLQTMYTTNKQHVSYYYSAPQYVIAVILPL
jgi:hypothetical protein